LIVKGILLGLSSGVVCFGYCSPFLFSLMCADYQSSLLSRVHLLFEFSCGRLVAYSSFGALVGFIGQKLDHPVVNILSGIAILALSLLLISYGLFTGWPHRCVFLKRYFPKKKLPVLIGFFTGFHVCPPFLLAITYSLNLGHPLKGILFFLGFFIATTVFLFPFLFLSSFSKYEPLRWIAQMFAIVSGTLFFFIGLHSLFY